MNVLSFIPARGGSKRIPGKNLATVNGLSLLERAIASAVGRVVVSTDDEDIARDCRTFGVEVHERPAQLAHDHAQIEDALAHYLRREDAKPDAIVILQPTSPLRKREHVEAALALLEVTDGDSVVSVTLDAKHNFAGRLKPVEKVYPRQIDGDTLTAWVDLFVPFRDPMAERPRTQDLRPVGHENGAIYAFTLDHWRRTQNRMGGAMYAYQMDALASIDVDEPRDLLVAEAYEWILEGRHGR